MDEIERYRIMTEEEIAQMRDQQLLAHDPNLRAANRTDDAIRTILASRKLTPEMRRELEPLLLEYDAFMSNARDKGMRVAPPAPAPAMATMATMTTAPTMATTATTTTAPTTTMAAPDPEMESALEQVLAPLGKKKHEAAKHAIARMGDGGVTFDDKLQLVLRGKAVAGSNFGDLIHAMYSPNAYLMPSHTEDFLKALRSIEFPSHYIPNTILKAAVERAASGPSSAPASSRPGPSRALALVSTENLGSKKKTKKQKGFGMAALASLMHHAKAKHTKHTKPKLGDVRMYCLYP